MIKKLAVFGMVAMLVFAFAGVASASQLKNAANNASQCESAGGVYVAGTSGAPNTCTITTDLDPIVFDGLIIKASGNSGKGWSIDASQQQSEQVIVTKGTGEGQVGDPVINQGDLEVDACYNPGGKEMDTGHANCQ